MINHFIIAPRFGSTANGFETGLKTENLTQFDLIHEITNSVVDSLDRHQFRYTLLDNLTGNLDERDRLPLLSPRTFVICLGAGWSKKNNKNKNFSSAVAFGNKNQRIAKYILDAMNDWGKIAYFYHGCEKPKYEDDNPFIRNLGADVPIIEIRPFQINGPGVDDYWPHIRNFGESFAGALAEINRLES